MGQERLTILQCYENCSNIQGCIDLHVDPVIDRFRAIHPRHLHKFLCALSDITSLFVAMRVMKVC